MTARLRFLLISLIGLNWVLLLLSALRHAGALGGALDGVGPAWPTLTAQAGFALVVFLYVRQLPEPLREQDFLGLLRRLVLGPGLLALAGLGLGLLARLVAAGWPGLEPGLGAAIYTVNLGLFVFYVARVNYAWRSLVLFKSRSVLRRGWPLFELLLGFGLLFVLLDQAVPLALMYGLLGALSLFGVYLSANQKWVAYLSTPQRWQAMGYETLILGGLLLFLAYFRYAGRADAHLTAPAAQQAFLLLTASFAAFYAAAGLLVAFFNLPTSVVFEQRRAEVLSLQCLMQVIQRGQTAADIYRVLLESTIQTAEAHAAWLDVEPAEGVLASPPPAAGRYELSAVQTQALRAAFEQQGLLRTEFWSNDLTAQAAFRGLGLPHRSVLVQPLATAEQYYGTLYLLKNQPNGYETADLTVLQAFTSQAVLSLENLQLAAASLQNQRVQDELRIAALVQEGLIPKKLPTDDWFDIASYAQAAREVGGDFYDLLLLPGRRLAVLIGDVSGKGVTAAFHMAQMKGIFHSLMQPNPLAKTERTRYPVPAQFMTQANAALAHCLEKSSFITASLFLIDYENGGFMFARAGHCHALYYSSNQEKVEYFQSPGLGLGIIRGPGYEKHITNQFYDYAPGDVMVMYTDGIVEARDGAGNEYGEGRLLLRLEESYYRPADEIRTFIMADVHAFTAGQPMHDDQTLLVIKFKLAQPQV